MQVEGLRFRICSLKLRVVFDNNNSKNVKSKTQNVKLIYKSILH